MYSWQGISFMTSTVGFPDKLHPETLASDSDDIGKHVEKEVLQEVDCIKEAGEGSGDQESRDSNWSTVPLEKVGRFSPGHVSVVQISASKYSVLTVDDQKEGETEMEGGEIAIDDQEDIEEETMEMCDQMIRSEEDQLEEDILE
ncbi:unnamed protein product, partial [Brassica oleracea]